MGRLPYAPGSLFAPGFNEPNGINIFKRKKVYFVDGDYTSPPTRMCLQTTGILVFILF